MGARSQSYRVACAEGHVLQGHRTDGYQALRCPTCGEGIFVLPKSPLPEPATQASSPGRRPSSRPIREEEGLILSDPPPSVARARTVEPKHDDEAQIEWVDEAEQDAPAALIPYAPETSIEAPKPDSRPTPARPKAKAKPAPEAIPAGMIEVDDRPTLGERLWKRRNGLIFVGVAMIVVATIGVRLRQRHLEALPAIVEAGRTQGLAKLDAGDFHVAKQILVEAASAVGSLGGRVEGADEVIQGAKEAALFADRCGESLETLVESAAKADSEAAWTTRFDTLYKGQSIIVEDRIKAVPDPAIPGSTYEIDYMILYGRNLEPAGRGRIDLTGFRLFELEKPTVGETKSFGARLASMKFDKDKGEWLVGLVPDSGCFITHDKALSFVFGTAAQAEEDDR